jgi:hypothetical protein
MKTLILFICLTVINAIVLSFLFSSIAHSQEQTQTMQIIIAVQPMCPMPYGSVPVNDLAQCQELQISYHTQCNDSDCTIEVN